MVRISTQCPQILSLSNLRSKGLVFRMSINLPVKRLRVLAYDNLPCQCGTLRTLIFFMRQFFDNVLGPPSNYDQAYWEIRYIRTYLSDAAAADLSPSASAATSSPASSPSPSVPTIRTSAGDSFHTWMALPAVYLCACLSFLLLLF